MTTAVSPPLQLTTDARPARRTGLAERYLLFLGCVLMGYALDGRGFAYLGVPPLFIGEIALLLGIGVLLRAGAWRRLWEAPPIIVLSAFFLLGIGQTAANYSEYGMDALRDAAVFYYGAFAVIVAGLLINEPRRLTQLLGLYYRFIPIFLIGIPIVAILYRGLHDNLPRWPWGDTPMIQEKEGDVMVHLAGALAFWTSGLVGAVSLIFTILLAANAAILGQIDRAGLVSFGASMGLGMLHKPKSKLAWHMIGGVIAAVVLLAVTGVHIEIPGGKGRELSFDQVMLNLTSITGDSGLDGMDSTKEWRMSWWKDIVDDDLLGRHRWTGRGFGINLADEYGYQVMADHSLRSPHNAHMTVLARMGAPGFALWIVLQFTWLLGVVKSYWLSRRAGDVRWTGVFFFLGTFWLAFLINASFDVFLEGPMGGIWFWTVFGVGAAAVWIYERRPEVMYF